VFSGLTVSEKEMRDIYEKHKHEIRGNKSFESQKSVINRYLLGLKKKSAYQSYLSKLEKELNVDYVFKPKGGVYVKGNSLFQSSIGNKSAKLHIYEFADLECGACKKAYKALKPILNKYKDQIYFEYRHYPLHFHQYSKQYARASVCAGKQDKHFEYIDHVFLNQENLKNISPESLAKKLNLNMTLFSQCINSDLSKNVVNEDIKEGDRIGVKSTPTFILNGQVLIGVPSELDILQYL